MLRVTTLVMAFAAVAVHAEAHHEALFGPQSALALSGEKIFSAQVFTRQTGPRNERVQETTAVLSTALSPTNKPLSLSIVVPFSVIAAGSHGGTRVGVENAIVAARYRVDLPGVARALGSEEHPAANGRMPTEVVTACDRRRRRSPSRARQRWE